MIMSENLARISIVNLLCSCPGDENRSADQKSLEKARSSDREQAKSSGFEAGDTNLSSSSSRSDRDAGQDGSSGGGRKKKQRWTHQEDELLKALVERYGTKCWSKLAQDYFGSKRCGDQLRAHYTNVLCPQRDRAGASWSRDEDLLLLRLHTRHGNKWKVIAEQMRSGRVPNDVKNRFWSIHKSTYSSDRPRSADIAPNNPDSSSK
mmetsp:Transcript_7729/g.16525  ORF Transcript_7729/g.16525 Transcript_7729/m.16525 type:complete len:206 (+) Transcript_7729:342-959(+)